MRTARLLLALSTVTLVASTASAQSSSWAGRLQGARLEHTLSLDPDPNARVAAAMSLATRGDPSRSLDALTTALERERTSIVRAGIARALALRGDPRAVPSLTRAFDASSDADSRPLAAALGALATPDAIGVLAAALDRADLLSAARVGLERAGARAIPFLLRRLRESGSVVAAELLGSLRDPSALPRLVVAASSDSAALRRAAIRALGTIGDSRALPRVRAALDDPDAGVKEAATLALAQLATVADSDRIVELLAQDNAPGELLEALLRVDPARGEAAIVERITSTDPAKVRVAADFALSVPDPRLVSVVYGIFEERTRRAEAAGALAELEGGAGIPVLLEEAEDDVDARRGLAVALRRWPEVSGDLRSRALAALREHPDTGGDAMRGWTLRALARDATVQSPLEQRLDDADPPTRAWAARALALLGSASASRVERRLRVETDPEAFRRLADLAVLIGAEVSEGRAMHWLSRAPTAALQILGAVPPTRTSRRALRRSLRASDPAARATAALALAHSGDVDAWRALVERLDQEGLAEVRLAAATALSSLSTRASFPSQAREAMLRRGVIEAEPAVRARLLGPVASLRGRRILRFRIAAAGTPEGVLVDIVLPGGAWLRMRTLPTGEIFVPDQPAGVADVRVRVADSPS